MEACSQVKGSFGDKGLDILLSTADEFQQYHKRVEEDLHASEVGLGASSSFTTQIQDIIRRVRRSERSL